MSYMSNLTPVNLIEEREKFFQDQTYNPQFQYTKQFSEEELTKWGVPNPTIVSHSFAQLLHPESFSSVSTENYINEEYISKKITEFNQKQHLSEPLQVTFSTHLVSRCAVSLRRIDFQLPIQYTKETFAYLCRHELETHILRRLNHKTLNWPENKISDEEKSGFQLTEEGLATLHTYLDSQDKVLLRTYLSYIGVYLSLHYSFSEMYQKLRSLGCSTQRSWNISVRNKRGITDTSQKTAFTKDVVYLEGALQVWNWIVNQHNDARDLYIGRLSLADIEKFRTHIDIDKNQLRYPSFFDDIDSYRNKIAEIGQVNNFPELLKEVPP